MRRLIKTKFKVDAAKSFADSVKFNSSYYVFASTPAPVKPFVSDPLDKRADESALFNSMLFGKRVKYDDIRLSTRRYDWALGTVYDMYDDQEDLSNKKFYVSVKSGVDLNVYKCLFNNGGVPSTVEPSGKSESPFETMEDGYVWKYMFTVSSLDIDRFANRNQLPIIEQTDIIQAATPGSIDVIKVEDQGLLYNNYFVGSFVGANDIRVNGNPLLYALPGTASNIDGFYKNCLIRINSNTSTNGQYKLITDYKVVDGRKLITLDSPFDIPPAPADNLEIYPNVFIYDTSNSATEECVARAIINPAQANSISKIEILKVGRGYRTAEAKIIPDSSVDILPTSEAILRPIIGPVGGHGSDPFNELNSNFVAISSIFSGNTGPIIANNFMQTVGLIKEPLFADCDLSLDPTRIEGEFIPNEKIYRFRPIELNGTVDAYANGIAIGANTQFTASLRENDKVLIVGSGGQMFVNVSIVDDTTLRLQRPPLDEIEDAKIYYAPNEYFAEAVEFSSSTLKLRNVVPTGFSVSQYIFGEISQAYAKTESSDDYLKIGTRKFDNFDIFNQIVKLEGLKLSNDDYVQGELITQDNGDNSLSDATAVVHSFKPGFDSQLDSLYVTNEFNLIEKNRTITTSRNDSSQIIFEISNKYNGELVKDSGTILYVENIDAIKRKDDQTEIIKFYLEF